MRLDMSTAEVVAFLLRRGYSVHSPIIVQNGDDQCTVALRGNHQAIVSRGEDRHLKIRTEALQPCLS